MAGRYKAYPEYKDSGVELLGDIPSGWVVDKFRYLFSLGRGLGITKANLQDSGISCVNYGEIHSKYGFEVSPDTHPLRCVSELYLESSPNSLLSNGDCIFADTSEDIEGAGNFTQLTSDQALFAGYHTVIARPKGENDARFLAYVFDSPAYRTQIRLGVKGVKVFSITQEILKNTDLWLAPLPEQKQIAKFLDHETAKIDLLIAKQQALIALLKEKRQAVISHAVTKGLNPNAKMKDSGVEWLGQVPEHWEVKPLKLVVKTRKGVAFKSTDFCDEGVRVVKASDIKQLSINSSEVFLPKGFTSAYPKALLKAGDVILSTVGSNPDVRNSAVGQVGMVPPELDSTLLNQNTVVFDPDENEVERSYFFHALQTIGYRDHLDLNAHGTANQSSLSIVDMLDFMLPLPPMIEQVEIAIHLSSQIGSLQSLERRSLESEQLLQERRTALISAAVTGRIDVRDWTAPESEDVI